MDARETCEERWKKMSVQERRVFLDKLSESTGRRPNWWGGKTNEELAELKHHELPDDLGGRLMMAWTPEGFAVAESERVEGELVFVGLDPRLDLRTVN